MLWFQFIEDKELMRLHPGYPLARIIPNSSAQVRSPQNRCCDVFRGDAQFPFAWWLMKKPYLPSLLLHRFCHADASRLCTPFRCPFFRFRTVGREPTRGNFGRNVWTDVPRVGAVRSRRPFSNVTAASGTRPTYTARVFDFERGVIPSCRATIAGRAVR